MKNLIGSLLSLYSVANKVIIVIKDTVDLKNLIEYKFLFKKLLLDKICITYSKFQGDELDLIFEQVLDRKCNDIEHKPLLNLDKLGLGLIWIKRLTAFACNFFYSVSARQKFFELIGLKSIRPLLDWGGSFYIRNAKHRIADVENLFTNFNDLIILMRSDASQNILVRSQYPNNIVINVIRNIDTPFLKGPPVVDSQVILNLHAKILENSDFYYFKPQYLINITAESRHATLPRRVKLKILYAMSSPSLIPNEINIIHKIQDSIGGRASLYVKPHQGLCRQDRKLIAKNFELEYSCNLANVEGAISWVSDLEMIAAFDVVIGCTTTFLYDANKIGVEKLFYVTDPRYISKFHYRREHLRRAISRLNCRLLTDLDCDLMACLL